MKNKNNRLKFSIGVHSKNTRRWVIVPVCPVCPVSRVEGFRGSAGGGLAAPPRVPSVQALR